MARASPPASAARVERARHQPDCRPPRQPTRRLAPYRGARQPTSQRGPRRASTVAASQPPPLVAVALRRTAPWCAPAYKPAQPVKRAHAMAASQPPSSAAHAPHRAAPRRSPAYGFRPSPRGERLRRRPYGRRPRHSAGRPASNRGARQHRGQHITRRASESTAGTNQSLPKVAGMRPRGHF